jgi:hypothetical protein
LGADDPSPLRQLSSYLRPRKERPARALLDFVLRLGVCALSHSGPVIYYRALPSYPTTRWPLHQLSGLHVWWLMDASLTFGAMGEASARVFRLLRTARTRAMAGVGGAGAVHHVSDGAARHHHPEHVGVGRRD